MAATIRPGRRQIMGGAAVLAGAPVLLGMPSRAAGAPIHIAEMSWIAVRDAILRGARTVIVPTGGLEQNGPHMVIGKHDHVVGWAAQRIAERLGNTLVAPVLSYVPEGDYDPPTGHMGFPGTIGLPPAVFEAVLDGIARSLKAGGFSTICFISDHGGSVAPQSRVVARLAAEWRGGGPQVIDVSAYYAAQGLEDDHLRATGETAAALGDHGGLADTAELLAIDPGGVDLLQIPPDPVLLHKLGASGDPRRANPDLGRALIALRIEAAVRQIRQDMAPA